jgi:glycosyltransferase involved in cell wall biosynthesis
MTRRIKRIMFLTTIEFRQPFNGGTSYSFSLFQAMQRIADVDVCILREMRKFRSEILHSGASLLTALNSDVPLNVIYHSGLLCRTMPDMHSYDLVVADHIEAYEAVRKVSVPCVVVAHNLEFRLASDKLKSGAIASLVQLHARLERYEFAAFRQAAGVICISASERQIVKKMNSRTVQLLPAFAPASKRPPRETRQLRLGFLGPASWAPNRRTIALLVEGVLPHLSRPVELVIAGKGWEDSGIPFTPGISLMGFVKNLASFWHNIDMLIAPTQQGAGVNIKICEALHNGVPVLTNTASATAIFGEGPLPANVMLADTNTALVEVLERLSLPEESIQSDLFTQITLQNRLRRFLNSLGD